MRRGITTHGLAINVNNDLQPFEWVVACGIEAVRMTSLGRDGLLPCFTKRVAYAYAQRLGRRQRLVSRARVQARPPVASVA